MNILYSNNFKNCFGDVKKKKTCLVNEFSKYILKS